MMRKKPMLAYPVSAKPIDYSKPTFIQPKLDGVRCVIQRENLGNTGLLFNVVIMILVSLLLGYFILFQSSILLINLSSIFFHHFCH